MPPVINEDMCVGCGTCEDSCPLDVIYMDEKEQRPYVKYPDECWHCGSCRQDCPEEAIEIRFPLRMLVGAGATPY
ncbi:MAG: ferredoxin family protein [Deltaproteobacteria bacterium]|nr:ferredoxin family protein [Deltaproteobacteria bacterium]MBW1947189.1 ferredoxin family protein [Deltaproteobacteria bacterium]MBW2017648.1 ferredoxin family protein [Deltaproteobacteria bacterium]MBW2130585.1 ferredoxin family protein [Deltaproteobacteria bacterium]MBW2305084.1 ferredoxin family protein [Deltaproteobacteria bacterium]